MALGKKIKGLRDELGMSQAQLAAQAGLSQGYLSQLENDEVQNPSAAVIFRLAESLHVDPRAIMQAAGYQQATGNGNDGEFEVAVDPDLLRYLSRLPREQQVDLLKMFRSMDHKPAVGVGRAAEGG
jgi:transcriptional regulator with XRE-family HTH domain